ncbi:PspC family transcriptional regulator [Amycolatopsis antarctica]|uniref:PspC family transcriptional regulator n=1 Tax=Amycolatopsis antarctica TaxID=1854586 RepID=A0A263DBR7_9PSEU|nr:PspC domain-containing protein [Amycolatopsis antarctica]OZM74947.1 PspC family transcriptional regulator [Amycolatopsis antarctica]
MSGTETPTPRPSGTAGFEETIKDFWVSRPRRPASGRKIAGVAAGVGERYGIDPVLVRVALAATAVFGGAGLVLYLLGWLFFADERDEVSAFEGMIGKGRTSMSGGFTAGLCIAVLPASGWAFGGGWFDGGGFIGLGLLCAGLYLLHRGRGGENRPLAPAPTTSGEYGYPLSTPFTRAAAGEGTPGWDPLAAAPLAWDLPGALQAPDPAPAPRTTSSPAQGCRRSKVTLVTTVLALAVGAAGAGLAANGATWFSPQHIVGLMLAVVALGLVVGSFVRGGRGLVGLFVPLAFAGVALTVLAPGPLNSGVGELNATPRSAAEIQPVYARSMGSVVLDLRELPAGAPVTTAVETTMGNSEVIVPATADVTFVCENKAGNTECFDRTSTGLGKPALSGQDLGADGAGGQQITLTVSSSAGNVEVRRG